MARIRTIKPSFFKHYDLFAAEKATGLPLRVAFAGLWTVADRAGRFKWRPMDMKPEILPHDDVDFEAVMAALVKYRFIFKYKCAGFEYGLIPSWSEHQVINNRETASAIPEPPAKAVSRKARVADASSTRHDNYTGEGEGKGNRNGKGEDDGDAGARAILIRVCEILRLNPTGNPEQITWLRAIAEMLRDGLTEAQIIAGAEAARRNGNVKMAYVRACAFKPPAEPKEAAHERPHRESSHEQIERISREIIARESAGDQGTNPGPHRGPGTALRALPGDDERRARSLADDALR